MVYQIKVAGVLDQSWAEWLGDIQIDTALSEDGILQTILVADLVDQAALFGILDHIRDLNLILLSVEIISLTKRKLCI